MQTEKFTKGQSVIGKGRLARTRYVVQRCHRDGTYTVKAIFVLDENGRDLPGSYLGFTYRVNANLLAPLAA